MIEKMKMVYVVSSVARKDEMLKELRDLSLLHLACKQSADRASIEKFDTLSQTASVLAEYAPDKKETNVPQMPVLGDEEFDKLYAGIREAMEKKAALSQEESLTTAEIERVAEWGDFDPAQLKELKEAGFDLHFYRTDKKACEEIMADPDVKAIRLASVSKMDTLAVIGTLPNTYAATEFELPKKSVSAMKKEVEDCKAGQAECTEVLKNGALYAESFNAQMLKAQNAEEFSAASRTSENDDDLVWISGYVPEVDLETFKAAAKKNGWAWAAEDVAEDDDKIPTKVRFNKVSAIIKPLFDILGIIPGYYEQDVSLWILLFFTLFFAMIIGDGGYGALILIATVAFHAKTKKGSNAIYLLYVLSIATIIWGAITGTWFGMESAMKVPFLKAIAIPQFANYPEYFGVSSTAQQNTIMKFSFSVGAIQMALGSLLAIKKKLPEKDLSWVSDLGWIFSICAMYMMCLYLVIGEAVNIKPVFAVIIVGFVMVIIFGGMAPDKTFGEGLKAGLGNAFTVFLDTISCFGNVMSYIRLFAVGMAGLAISQSFNGMAAGFSGPLIVVAVLIVIIGHALNIVMCFLSVVVHGVRLNVLEFSGQVGLEWVGIPYEPFTENTKLKK